MAKRKLTVELAQPEYSGLMSTAIAELRDPATQIRVFVREGLERRGKWPPRFYNHQARKGANDDQPG